MICLMIILLGSRLLSQYIYYLCMSGHLMGAAISVISELPLLASVSGFELLLSSFVAVACSVSCVLQLPRWGWQIAPHLGGN